MDGWGDDDFDLESDEGDTVTFGQDVRKDDAVAKEEVGTLFEHGVLNDVEVVDGWDDDDLDLDIPDEDSPACTAVEDEPTGIPLRRDLTGTESRIFQSLEEYTQSLPFLVKSLNSVLEAEYNTYEHALHLCEYYEKRPQLRDYTLETELPRMQYRAVLGDNTVLTEEHEVAEYIRNQPNSVLLRSANQSLLADILTVLTGPDLFIRPQYLATMVATKCAFTLSELHVQCDCRLNLSLPGITGDRVDIAFLDVSVILQPDIPGVLYQLKEINIVADANQTLLEDTSIFLASMEMDDWASASPPAQISNADAFRDSFLLQVSKTQQIVQASQTGFSSAWKQIDSVANVSSKLDFVKKVGGGMLPSLTVSDEISYQQMGVAPGLHHQMHSNTFYEEEVTANDQVPLGNRRPAPILGGFLMSGLNRLAKTVATPEEESSSSQARFPRPAHHDHQAASEARFPRPADAQIRLQAQFSRPAHRDHQAASEARFPRPADDQTHLQGRFPRPVHSDEQSKVAQISPPNQQDRVVAETAPTQTAIIQREGIRQTNLPAINAQAHADQHFGIEGAWNSDQENVDDGWEDDELQFDDEVANTADAECEISKSISKKDISLPRMEDDEDSSCQPEDEVYENVTPTGNAKARTGNSVSEAEAIDYNCDDDIIATRTRWTNRRMIS